MLARQGALLCNRQTYLWFVFQLIRTKSGTTDTFPLEKNLIAPNRQNNLDGKLE